MEWTMVIIAVLAVAIILAGGFYAARSPVFWLGLIGAAFKAARPKLIRIALPKIILPKFKKKTPRVETHIIHDKPLPRIIDVLGKRMTPEEEKAWHDCIRRAGKWNHAKKRCE